MAALIAVAGRGTPWCVHLPECVWASANTGSTGTPYPRVAVSVRRALDEHMVACKRCLLPLDQEVAR